MAGGGHQSTRRPRAQPLQDGRNTFYRIHGTNEPGAIGETGSSGCIRMVYRDVIDLYYRIRTDQGRPLKAADTDL